MKAILEFKLPEDAVEYKIATNAPNLHQSLYEFDQYLRSRIKHDDDNEDVYDCLVSVRDKLNEILLSNTVSLE